MPVLSRFSRRGRHSALPVFDLTLFRRYQAARETANASKSDSLSTREQVILLVVSQYIGTLRAVANVQASQSRVELAQALYDQAADVQKEGVGTGIDTLRANVELQNEKQRLLEAQADRDTSLFGLSRLLNLDPRQVIELGDSLSFFDTPQPEVVASIDSALAERQEWKALQEQLKVGGIAKESFVGIAAAETGLQRQLGLLGTHLRQRDSDIQLRSGGNGAAVYRRQDSRGNRSSGPGNSEATAAGRRLAKSDRAGCEDGADQSGFGAEPSDGGESGRAAFERRSGSGAGPLQGGCGEQY